MRATQARSGVHGRTSRAPATRRSRDRRSRSADGCRHRTAAMKSNGVPGLPRWITPNGEIDLERLPLDGILKQAIDPEFDRFRSACVLLGSMTRSGRPEAGLYLIGLLAYYVSD